MAVLAVSGDPMSLYVTWNPPTYPNGIITHYNIYCQESPLAIGSGSGLFAFDTPPSDYATFTGTVQGSDMAATLTGFTPFTNYGCQVSANTSVGEGMTSDTEFQTTDEYSEFECHVIKWLSAKSIHNLCFHSGLNSKCSFYIHPWMNTFQAP